MSLVYIQRGNDIIRVIADGGQERSSSPARAADSLLPVAQGFNAHVNQRSKLVLAEVQAFTNIPNIQGSHGKGPGRLTLAF